MELEKLAILFHANIIQNLFQFLNTKLYILLIKHPKIQAI